MNELNSILLVLLCGGGLVIIVGFIALLNRNSAKVMAYGNAYRMAKEEGLSEEETEAFIARLDKKFKEAGR